MSADHITYARYFQDTWQAQIIPCFGAREGVSLICRCREGAVCEAPLKHPTKKFKGQPSRLPNLFENYAVLSSRLVCVDYDSREPVEGVWNDLYIEHPTFQIETRKGFHVLYENTGPPVSTRIGIVPGVDIKSHNGYFIGPGSRRTDGGYYTPSNTLPIAPLPPEIVPALSLASSRTNTPVSHEMAQKTPGWAWPSVEQACEEMIGADGSRNTTLHRLACAMYRNSALGIDALMELAQCASRAGLGDTEIERTIQSAYDGVRNG